MSLAKLEEKKVIEFRGKRYPSKKFHKTVLGRPKLLGIVIVNMVVIIFAMILLMLFFTWFFSFF